MCPRRREGGGTVRRRVCRISALSCRIFALCWSTVQAYRSPGFSDLPQSARMPGRSRYAS